MPTANATWSPATKGLPNSSVLILFANLNVNWRCIFPFRLSFRSWVKDEEHSVVAGVSRRISSVVGLNAQPTDIGSELYQVATWNGPFQPSSLWNWTTTTTTKCWKCFMQVGNYGIGGRYTPHLDHGALLADSMDPGPMDYARWRGDRIATFMIYLDDVEAGGATVFTHIGATVWPRKNSAVFWWNLLSDLGGDPDTRHGGCPVLHGSKWSDDSFFFFLFSFSLYLKGTNNLLIIWFSLQ